ncbi:hypothetical protein EDB19DRAFT_1830220 [Suillus lakei]|nr:hypothetical protein EDB19DRAFT_1830220 [Suillus lakei]
MDQDNNSIKCECHGCCMQMLPHPCFTIEQFLEVIYLVQITPEEDLSTTEANNPTLESNDIRYPETPQICTYYEDSSDDEPSSPQGEGVPEENQWAGEEAPDCDVQEAPE